MWGNVDPCYVLMLFLKIRSQFCYIQHGAYFIKNSPTHMRSQIGWLRWICIWRFHCYHFYSSPFSAMKALRCCLSASSPRSGRYAFQSILCDSENTPPITFWFLPGWTLVYSWRANIIVRKYLLLPRAAIFVYSQISTCMVALRDCRLTLSVVSVSSARLNEYLTFL